MAEKHVNDETPDEREARLPRWAQAEMARLRNQLAGARQDVIDGNYPGETDTTVDMYAVVPRKQKPGSVVEFKIGDSREEYVLVRTRKVGH